MSTNSTDTHGIFNAAAPVYETMNDILSLGLHHGWRQHFLDCVPWSSLTRSFQRHDATIESKPPPVSWVDMACGTGHMARLILQRVEQCYVRAFPDSCGKSFSDTTSGGQDVSTGYAQTSNLSQLFRLTGVEPNSTMRAQNPITHPCFHWSHVSAQEFTWPKNSLDVYTLVFGLRNIPDTMRPVALARACRALRPEGLFLCMEFSPSPHTWVQAMYSHYLRAMPYIGRLVADIHEPYAYLAQSIRDFPGPWGVCPWLAAAGFSSIGHTSLAMGLVTIYWATKSHESCSGPLDSRPIVL